MISQLPPAFQHLPLLVVVIPMLAAPLAMMIGRTGASFWLAVFASLASFLGSLILLITVHDGTVLSYHIGGWAPPIGIEYRIDIAAALVMVIVSMLAVIVLPYARTSIANEIPQKNHGLFYACVMLCFTGLMGVVATGDAFNVFVFLEISSLSTYVLVALGADKDRRALSAAYDYLVLGTIGATFFVIGLGMLYMATGTLNMVDIAERLRAAESNRTIQTAFAFIVVGMGLKVAIYPLHRWLPGAYTYAPSAVSAFLAATATKVALYVVIRFMLSVYSPGFGYEREMLTYIIMPVGIVAMFLGSMVAVFQVNLKRLLAWSSIAQIGYMLVGISLLNVTGLSASLVHMFNHAVTKGALFLAVGGFVYAIGKAQIPALAGMGKRMPWTSAGLVIAALSLIGVPGTAGFVSKWILLQAAAEQGSWFIGLLVVASSLFAIVYMGKVIETLYFRDPPEGSTVADIPLSMLLPLWVLVAIIVWFGISAEWTAGTARLAAESLLNGGFLTDTPLVLGVPGR
ncbi:monovalent cation/H+ antiporter subunit D family protein [Pseudahrensia aquimaris]|uniref:Monovalent cation/H+ antiporter subunit D family protein n=1 Tax=Pseudahrensia aquimaris TaxID=744461 RepID=A0ABW3FBQ5_9HYPH